jgi:hypothetical protein
MVRLYGCAGRLTAQNGGVRPGQVYADCGSQFVSATSGLIIQKALTVRLASPTKGGGPAAAPAPAAAAASSAKTPSEISNLLGNDVLQTQVAFMYLSFLTWGIVGFVGAVVMLVLYLGWAASLAGIGVSVGLGRIVALPYFSSVSYHSC